MFQKIELRKTRDFSAKINITFEFIRQNFKTLGKAVMFISGPAILAQGLFSGIYRQKTMAQGQGESFYRDFLSDLWLETSTVFLLLAYVISLTVVNEFVRLYEIKEDPRTIETAEIWVGVKKNFFRMLFALIFILFQTLIGLILLVIPGIYLIVTLSLVPPILIIEKRGVLDSFWRSYSLITATEKWWSTFGLIMVTIVIIFFMSVVFSLPQAVFV